MQQYLNFLDMKPAGYVLLVGALFGWRLNWWLRNRAALIVKVALHTALANELQSISTHTVQIAGLQGKSRRHSRQVVQIVEAGLNTVNSAAIWSKRPPSPREVEIQISDWRKILGSDDIDRGEN